MLRCLRSAANPVAVETLAHHATKQPRPKPHQDAAQTRSLVAGALYGLREAHLRRVACRRRHCGRQVSGTLGERRDGRRQTHLPELCAGAADGIDVLEDCIGWQCPPFVSCDACD